MINSYKKAVINMNILKLFQKKLSGIGEFLFYSWFIILSRVFFCTAMAPKSASKKANP